MSAASRIASDRKPWSLSLFPLHTVLFPGGLLPLKIFEQRYIDMAKACMRDERPFGVCMITQGSEVDRRDGSAVEFAPVGTLARITNFDMPQLGILHVVTEGGARFQVRDHAASSSGLVVADVTTIDDEPRLPMPEAHAPLVRLLHLIAERIGAGNFPATTLYDDASWVGYRLAELLPLPLQIKQSMLEINDAGVRLATLRQFLKRQGLLGE